MVADFKSTASGSNLEASMSFYPREAPLPIAVGVIYSQGRFLVARRKPGAHLSGRWEFPGGKLRPGESMESALRRELEEEAGIRFRSQVLLHVEEHSYPDRTVLLHFFLCLDPEGSLPGKVAPEGKEGQEMRWVSLDELKVLEVPAANRRLLKILEEQFAD